MEIVLRAAGIADIPSVLALWAESDAHPTHTDDPVSLEQLLRHDSGALIVADDDGRLVGSVIAAWDGWRGSVYRLVVAPDRRRSGLGRWLIAAAEARLHDAGASRLQAIVLETDVQASGFWRSTGWEQQVERLRFVKG
jgi:ribosomal protein S18 acetylase RimI-like enzyme